MLLKLYKTEEDGKILYWEAWNDGEEIVVHFGEVGTVGQTNALPLAEFEPPETAIRRLALEAQEAGFKEIDHEELFEFIVQYPLTPGDADLDNERAARAEEALNECLGWNGLGHCDGTDVGDAVNVYCYVIDPLAAVAPVLEELGKNELLETVVLAYQNKNENFIVLWPEDYDGIFFY